MLRHYVSSNGGNGSLINVNMLLAKHEARSFVLSRIRHLESWRKNVVQKIATLDQKIEAQVYQGDTYRLYVDEVLLPIVLGDCVDFGGVIGVTAYARDQRGRGGWLHGHDRPTGTPR
jgi:hypothetical protein